MAIEPFLGTRSQKIFLSTIVVQAIVVLALVAAVLALVRPLYFLYPPEVQRVEADIWLLNRSIIE